MKNLKVIFSLAFLFKIIFLVRSKKHVEISIITLRANLKIKQRFFFILKIFNKN